LIAVNSSAGVISSWPDGGTMVLAEKTAVSKTAPRFHP
jgi:hypothetical protein